MKNTRHLILHLADEGRIAPGNLRKSLMLADALPAGADWRRFLDVLLLWLGTVQIAAAVVFFFAYNWNDLGRFAKFGLAEGAIVISLAAVWRLGLEGVAGKAALTATAVLIGALLALIGQTYQTGADTFELFGTWSAAILPFALIGRFPALWVVWLVLENTAAVLYYQTFGGFFGFIFMPERLLWVLFGMNTTALALWEVLVARGLSWLNERWAVRLLALASCGLITALVFIDIFDSKNGGPLAGLAWFAWLGAAYLVYRQYRLDGFMLATGVLSIIAVVATFLSKHLFDRHMEAGRMLFIGLVVIGLSAAGGWWLREVLKEERA